MVVSDSRERVVFTVRPEDGDIAMTRSIRLLRSLASVVLVAALLATGVTPVSGMPAIRAIEAAAPDGRLIVFWRPGHQANPANLSDGRIASASTVAGRAGARSLVVARPGTAAALAARLRSDPDVVAVVPDARIMAAAWPSSGSPSDPYYATSQADLPLIGMPTAWRTTTGSASVVVAVLDSGTTPSHADLAGITLVSPYNEITNTAGATDDWWHGTHITGTIAAQTNNGTGIAGIAPGVSIMPIKVLDSTGTGYFSDFLDAVDYAVANGAKILNMSLAASLDAAAVAAAQPTIDAAHAAGVTIIAAAGNYEGSAVKYPCAFDHVICVAATDNSDAHASFSNANAFVDISAPGVAVMSTYPLGCSPLPSCYSPQNGTSMATPHVVGVAALVLSAWPAKTPDQVEAALVSTAVDLGTPGRDNTFGHGRVDAGAAVAFGPVPSAPTGVAATAGNASALVSWTAPASVGGSAFVTYTVTSSPGGKTCTTGGALTCTVTGLTNGTPYTFSVVASNPAGPGPPSAPSAAVTPATVPGAPTRVVATPGNASAFVSWTAPADDGGDAITSYAATSAPDGRTCVTNGGLACTVTGLTNGTAYAFSVKAANGIGSGPSSVPSAAVTPAPTVPGAPTGVVATPGNASALVSWTAPADDGGDAITSYTATSTPGGRTCATGSALTCTVTGLTDGTAYTFSVQAANGVGSGPASDPSAAVTPEVTVPPAASIAGLPTWLNTTSVPLRWSATMGTAPIASYDVRYRRAAWNGSFGSYVTWRLETLATSATFSASSGYTYCFAARARDVDGSLSAWTADTCTAVPLDDRSLARYGRWTARTGTAYFRSTSLRSSTYGAEVTRTRVVARRMAILATTCPTCGSVRVYWGSKLLRTISLKSTTRVDKKLIPVATFASRRTGTLKIKVYSSGKKVLVDGVAIRRN